MRKCVSCDGDIPDGRRKDARYCNKAACRGREYRKRRAAAALAAPQLHGHEHRASAVLHCQCGKRYLLQGNSLEARELGDALLLAPATNAPTPLTQTDPHTERPSPEPDPGARLADRDPEPLTQTVLHTEACPSEPAPALTHPLPHAGSLTETDREQQEAQLLEPQRPPTPTPTVTELLTIELCFTDGKDRPISFWNAVSRQTDRRWRLKPHAKLAFGFAERDYRGLGGVPGRWREFYGDQSPTKFGYDPNLVVMNWDHKADKGHVVPVGLLDDILGVTWKEQLRQMRDGKP